jgi:hypothetical protein
MAITDRNLSIGTMLYARYKGQTYTAEVIEIEGKTRYRVHGKERTFGSPSAAGTAVTGLACNGWAFWTVGEPPIEGDKPAKTKAQPPATITAAPKPQAKRGARKGQTAEPPAGDDKGGDEAPTATQPDDQPVTCATCGETFPGVEAATEHYYATHGKPDEEGEPTA